MKITEFLGNKANQLSPLALKLDELIDAQTQQFADEYFTSRVRNDRGFTQALLAVHLAQFANKLLGMLSTDPSPQTSEARRVPASGHH